MGDGERLARLNVAIFWQSRVYAPSMLEERVWSETALRYDGLAPQLRAETLAVASFRDVGAGDWAAAIGHAREAIDLAPEPGEGIVAGAYGTLAIALMVTDPDAAERALDAGIERVRRARAPVFSADFLGWFKVSTALMRGDAEGAVSIGLRLRAQSSPSSPEKVSLPREPCSSSLPSPPYTTSSSGPP